MVGNITIITIWYGECRLHWMYQLMSSDLHLPWFLGLVLIPKASKCCNPEGSKVSAKLNPIVLKNQIDVKLWRDQACGKAKSQHHWPCMPWWWAKICLHPYSSIPFLEYTCLLPARMLSRCGILLSSSTSIFTSPSQLMDEFLQNTNNIICVIHYNIIVHSGE